MLFRAAFRSLRSRPAYALVAVFTIALVVGPGSAIVAVADATLLRALPFPQSDRLLQLFSYPPGIHDVTQRNPLGALDLVRFRERSKTMAAIGGVWSRERAIGGDAGVAESVPVGLVSASYFDVLGIRPALGRVFTDDEDRAGAKVAVLGAGLWQRRFGGDRSVVGRTIAIDRESYQIIGVMPDFREPATLKSEIWTPLGVHAGNLVQPSATFIQTFARMAPGATAGAAQAEVSRVMADVSAEAPSTRGGWTAEAVSLRDAQYGQSRAALLILLAGAAVLVAIACGNLANVTVAEVASRRGELTLRAALGASRADLIRPLAAETVLIAAAGGVAGALIGGWLLPLVLRLDPTAASTFGGVRPDWRMETAAALAAFLIAGVAGGVPALAETRGDVARGMAAGARRIGSRRDRRLRAWFVAAQIALAVTLVAGGGVLIAGFASASRVSPGFDPHHVLGAQVRLPASAYGSAEARVNFVSDVLRRIRALPGVTSASTTHNLFIPGFAWVSLVSVEGHPSPDGRPYTVQFRRVSPRYFETMRIPLLHGRDFDDGDIATTQKVAVVSESFARQYFAGGDAIGGQIRRGQDLWTVVGIAGDVRDVSLSQAEAPTLYITYAQNNLVTASIGLVIRTAGDPSAMASSVAAAVRAVDPQQPLSNVTTLDGFLADSLGPERFRGVILTACSAVGLLLAAVGIYGVNARAAAERTREMGLRLALGSSPGAVSWLVVRQASTSVLWGLAAGACGAAAAMAALRHWIGGLDAVSQWSGVPAVGVLLAVALIAAAIPAWRAGRVDPVASLRADR